MNWQLNWDRDYGMDKRTGWSIALEGVLVCEFERFLLVALWKSWRARKRIGEHVRLPTRGFNKKWEVRVIFPEAIADIKLKEDDELTHKKLLDAVADRQAGVAMVNAISLWSGLPLPDSSDHRDGIFECLAMAENIAAGRQWFENPPTGDWR